MVHFSCRVIPKDLKKSNHRFSAWRSAFRESCGEQAGKLACCVLGQGTKRNAPTFMWKTGGPNVSEIARRKQWQITAISCPKTLSTSFLKSREVDVDLMDERKKVLIILCSHFIMIVLLILCILLHLRNFHVISRKKLILRPCFPASL